MVKNDLDAMESKFDNFLKGCVDNIDKGEIVYENSTTKIDTTPLNIPTDLIGKLDEFYTGGVHPKEYRSKFITVEEVSKSKSESKTKTKVMCKEVVGEEKPLFSESK